MMNEVLHKRQRYTLKLVASAIVSTMAERHTGQWIGSGLGSTVTTNTDRKTTGPALSPATKAYVVRRLAFRQRPAQQVCDLRFADLARHRPSGGVGGEVGQPTAQSAPRSLQATIHES
jgi:hypothetical protein